MEQDLLAVGRITKSVGVRGEVKLEALSDRRQRFRELREVWVGSDGRTARRETVEAVRFLRDAPVVKLRGVDSRTAADELRGEFLFVEAASVAPLPEGSFYVHEIVGLTVVTEEGDAVGRVRDVCRLPGGDVWCVEMQGREIMIPAVQALVRRVDLREGKIVIRAIEGLLE
jgi:16S rRNA processing protein RimM